MRNALAALIIAGGTAFSLAGASAATYCLQYADGTAKCGFKSLEACRKDAPSASLPCVTALPKAEKKSSFQITADQGPDTVHGCGCRIVGYDCGPTLSGLTLCIPIRECGCWQ
jgi:hypothetical protein